MLYALTPSAVIKQPGRNTIDTSLPDCKKRADLFKVFAGTQAGAGTYCGSCSSRNTVFQYFLQWQVSLHSDDNSRDHAVTCSNGAFYFYRRCRFMEMLFGCDEHSAS